MFQFHKIVQFVGPIVAMIAGYFATGNFQGIQSGVYAADAGSYALTGTLGIGSISSLLMGLYSAWKTTGVVPITGAVELGSLAALAGSLAKDGDVEGLELFGPLAAHIVKRKGKAVPDISLLKDESALSRLMDEVLRRVARSEGGA